MVRVKKYIGKGILHDAAAEKSWNHNHKLDAGESAELRRRILKEVGRMDTFEQQ